MAEWRNLPTMWRLPKSGLKKAALGMFVAAILLLGPFLNHPTKDELRYISAVLLVALLIGLSDFLTKSPRNIAAFFFWFVFGCACLLAVDWHFWPRTSFTYVSPLAFSPPRTWDFGILHKGPDPSEGIEIMFTDEVKQKNVLDSLNKTGAPLTLNDINSYQKLINIPEMDPLCRNHMFAQQFLWTPPEIDHQHYSLVISAREIQVLEDLKIENVAGKWHYAAEIRNREGNGVLLNCRDKGFPGATDQDAACWPMLGQCEE